MSEQKKVLLCVSSLIRQFSDESFKSLIKNLLSNPKYQFDIIGSSPPINEKKIEILRPYCNTLVWRFEKDPDFSSNHLRHASYKMQNTTNIIKNNLLQWHSLERCGTIKDEIEKQNRIYDIVIWTRPDLLFVGPIDIPECIKKNTLYISDHDHWGGFNDRFCIADSATMSKRMKIYSYFNGKFLPSLHEEPNFILENNKNWCPEYVLAHLLKDESINVDISMSLFGRMRKVKNNRYMILPFFNGGPSYWPINTKNDDKKHVKYIKFLDLLKKINSLENSSGSITDLRVLEKYPILRYLGAKIFIKTPKSKRMVPINKIIEYEASQHW